MSHLRSTEIPLPAPGGKRIVLVGNPNVGKSVLFFELTGVYVDVSNYPGTTVEWTWGRSGDDVYIDTPGVYGISSFNDEEKVTREILMSADVVLNVVDAGHIERDLFLTLQLLDMGLPMVIALNMLDEAEAQGIQVDTRMLETLLGVAVVPTVAVKGTGIRQSREALQTPKIGKGDLQTRECLIPYRCTGCSSVKALLLAEDDEPTCSAEGVRLKGKREWIYRQRRHRVEDICAQVVFAKKQGKTWSQRLGSWMLHPVWGLGILLVVLAIAYAMIGVGIAQTIVDGLEKGLFTHIYDPWIRTLVGNWFDPASVIGQLLVGEFGLLTMAVTYVFGLLLPLVAGFYLLLSLLEDSGYLPRLAVLVDRWLVRFGLNGRAIIPLILGLGCVTMATITTRLLGSQRERTIAAALLGLTIPCSAQLGVIAGMLAERGLVLLLVYAAIMIVIFVAIGTILERIIPGQTVDLFIDLPPVRFPRIGNILRKTEAKSSSFLREAAPLFGAGAVLVTTLRLCGALEALERLFSPLTVSWLGLPKEAAGAFIMGMIRRDFGAAGLIDVHMDGLQTLVALVTLTLFVPCLASILIFFKERSAKEAWAIWLGSWVIAFGVGGIIYQLLV